MQRSPHLVLLNLEFYDERLGNRVPRELSLLRPVQPKPKGFGVEGSAR